MILKKVRDLAIAKSTFFFTTEGINLKEDINYTKWVEYINNHLDYFIWSEDTEEGQSTLANIDKVPNWARERVLNSLNKNSCSAEFDTKKKCYNIVINRYDKRIGIAFERIPNVDDLNRFLDMATYLDALLLNNGKEIINEKVIENLK